MISLSLINSSITYKPNNINFDISRKNRLQVNINEKSDFL